jgi:hypothetical protein
MFCLMQVICHIDGYKQNYNSNILCCNLFHIPLFRSVGIPILPLAHPSINPYIYLFVFN